MTPGTVSAMGATPGSAGTGAGVVTATARTAPDCRKPWLEDSVVRQTSTSPFATAATISAPLR